MQGKIKLSTADIAGIFILLVLLVCVRVFQSQLFYDPLLAFFKKEGVPLPPYNSARLFFGIAFRYILNALLSLGIIWLVFKDRAVICLCAILYAILFTILAFAYFIILAGDDVNLLLLFYIRRFLIQPLFLILFLPAFYYQKYVKV